MFPSVADVSCFTTCTLHSQPNVPPDDDSYRAAKQMVEKSALGEVHAVETTCLDQQDPTGFFVTFSAQSGGIFVDMGVHDVSEHQDALRKVSLT